MADFLQRWDNLKKFGITRETILALKQTCLLLRDCTLYLLETRIVARAPAVWCYWASFMMAKATIRSKLFYLNPASYWEWTEKFSGFTLADIDDVIQTQTESTSQSDNDLTANDVAESLTHSYFPSSSDANLNFYVSEYIARSIVSSMKYDDSREVVFNQGKLLEPL